MQLASTGARALKPTGGGAFAHPSPSRSIHIPSFIPRRNVAQAPSTAQTIFKQTRTILSRFVAHLTTPGTLRLPANAPGAARSLYSGPTQVRTIQQGLSLPARYALSRPLQAPHLPRVPAVPRGVSQVGLGLARNFSTGRPVFQNLVENVPVSGRAFWEADWDMKMQKERERLRLRKSENKKSNGKARGQMMQPKQVEKKLKASTVEDKQAELAHYFPAAANPDVTTHLLIPLAPIQTSRMPLPVAPAISTSTHPLLPFPIIASVHTAHSTHALRVSSLFARLDAARVFESPGVCCDSHGDPSGLCTLLEVRFEGWDEARVRSVLGEAGRGWCVIEEVWKDQENKDRERMEEVLEAMSCDGDASWSSGPESPQWHQGVVSDPAHSLVLPTLDFSSTFPITTNDWSSTSSPSSIPMSPEPPLSTDIGMPSALSDLQFHNAWSATESDLDSHSDGLSEVSSGDFGSPGMSTDSSWVDTDFVSRSPPASERWFGFGFSSEFSGRMQEADEPREQMF